MHEKDEAAVRRMIFSISCRRRSPSSLVLLAAMINILALGLVEDDHRPRLHKRQQSSSPLRSIKTSPSSSRPRKTLIGRLRNRVFRLFSKSGTPDGTLDKDNTDLQNENPRRSGLSPRKRGSRHKDRSNSQSRRESTGSRSSSSTSTSASPKPKRRRRLASASAKPPTDEAGRSDIGDINPEHEEIVEVGKQRNTNALEDVNSRLPPAPSARRRSSHGRRSGTGSLSPWQHPQRGQTMSVTTSVGSSGMRHHVAFGTQSGGESVEEAVYHFNSGQPPIQMKRILPQVSRRVPVPRESRAVPYSVYIDNLGTVDTEYQANEAEDEFFTFAEDEEGNNADADEGV
mmetsp:Transcript_12080/g.29712  ORF Transcript_12080/g.29712 Transcript_12080/m.29712 type:complete len:343 (-) Transcript_12080:147-1175(-)|eukprot:CAMPEP_0114494664 /NCGR_PEP_ID=MMETSP0109-20121206/4775_1 /TAXON_ID=29199 /ORGANISM="Chlorarachnion reptans, Strain CCCM449" /LENGTH=342 /DNA_ID=CAMNT_0001671721 /DNA_START=396 /DNA_END=1424 /DNA_ORIENTATION=+